MSKAAEILDENDIKNLADIYDMFTAIISRCNLSYEDYKIVHKTCNNLKILLDEISGLSAKSV